MVQKTTSVLVCACFVQSYGITRYTLELLKNLVRIDSSLAITLLVSKVNRERFRELEPVVVLKTIPFAAFVPRLLYFHLFVPFITRRYGLVHCVGNLGLFWTKTPQILSIMDTYECSCPQRFALLKRIAMRLAIAASGRNAAAILTISDNTSRDVGRYYPALKGKTRRIYLGTSARAPGAADRTVAADAPYLCVGTLEPGKNLVTALKALARYRAQGGTRCLHIVGAQGWRQQELFRTAAYLGSGGEVSFLGYLGDEDLAQKYATAFALAFTWLYE